MAEATVAIFGWLSKWVSPAGEAKDAGVPGEFADDEGARTDTGRYLVVLHELGPNPDAVREALRVLGPDEHVDDDPRLPFVVRRGLTEAAAKAIQQRLSGDGARVGIVEGSI